MLARNISKNQELIYVASRAGESCLVTCHGVLKAGPPMLGESGTRSVTNGESRGHQGVVESYQRPFRQTVCEYQGCPKQNQILKRIC